MAYKFLPHTGDVKVLASGKTIEEAFSFSAAALRETISGKLKIKTIVEKTIHISGKNYEALLYNFLEEIIYLLDAEDFAFSKLGEFKIHSNKEKFLLDATLLGDKASGYKFGNEVKAITYNEMFVKRGKDEAIVQFVLDV